MFGDGGRDESPVGRRFCWLTACMRRLLRSLCAVIPVVFVAVACSTSSPAPERFAQVSDTCADFSKDSVISVSDGDARLDMTTALSPKASRVEQHVTVTIAGKLVYRSDGVADDKRVSVIGKYIGAQPSEDVVVSYQSNDGKTGELEIGTTKVHVDIEAIKADPATFGKKLPNVVAPAVMARIAAVFGKLNGDAPDSCAAPAATPGVGMKSQPGHHSNPGGSSECLNCRFRCDVGWAACATIGFYGCMKGCAALLPLWPAGPVLFSACILVCNTVTLLSCDAARNGCLSTCTGSCCPVTCGTRCCDEGESCLDAPMGLCCPPNLSPCPGATPTCFDPRTEICNPTGKACPIARDCRDKCCPMDVAGGGIPIGTVCADDTPNSEICCPQQFPFLCRPLDPTVPSGPGTCCTREACIRGQCVLPNNGGPGVPAL